MFRRSPLGIWLAQRHAALRFAARKWAHNDAQYRDRRTQWWRPARNVLPQILLPVLTATVAILVTVLIPVFYANLANGWGFNPNLIPGIEPSNAIGIFGTIATIATAVLALIYTAISVVISSRYASVPGRVYALIAEDPLNTAYMHLLAHLAVASTVFLGLSVLNVPLSALPTIYTVAIASLCLLYFIPVGFRAFGFFTPSSIAGYPMRSFARAADLAADRSPKSFTPVFQNHAKSVAENALNAITDLVHIAMAERQPRGNPSLDIASAMLDLVRAYAAGKGRIPTASKWFPVRADFKPWELIDSIITQQAIETGSTPKPTLLPNHTFVEETCADVVQQTFTHLLSCGAVDDAGRLAIKLEEAVSGLCARFHTDGAKLMLDAARPAIVRFLSTEDAPGAAQERFILVETFCATAMSPINRITFAYANPLVPELLAVAEAVHRLDRRSVYAGEKPRNVLRTAESFLESLAFERDVEGRVVTPLWFVRQTIALEWRTAIDDTMGSIASTIEQQYLAPGSELFADKRANEAAWWLLGGIAACAQGEAAIGHLEGRAEELSKHNRCGDAWPALGAEAARRRVETARAAIVGHLADLVPSLADQASEASLPDVLGRIRSILAEELVTRASTKREDGFGHLFVAFTNASFAIHDRYLSLANATPHNQYHRLRIDVLLDLMAVSGLALIFSELDGTSVGQESSTVWDAWLTRVGDPKAMVQTLVDAICSKWTAPLMSSNAMQRQEWQKRLAEAMTDRGIDPNRHRQYPRPNKRVWVHQSAVVESIHVNNGHASPDAFDYFGALYLSEHQAANGITSPASVRRCRETIDRIRTRMIEDQEDNREGGSSG